jgi:hypothetical protein
MTTAERTEQLVDTLSSHLLGERLPIEIVDSHTGEVILAANRKITKTLLRRFAGADHANLTSRFGNILLGNRAFLGFREDDAAGKPGSNPT